MISDGSHCETLTSQNLIEPHALLHSGLELQVLNPVQTQLLGVLKSLNRGHFGNSEQQLIGNSWNSINITESTKSYTKLIKIALDKKKQTFTFAAHSYLQNLLNSIRKKLYAIADGRHSIWKQSMNLLETKTKSKSFQINFSLPLERFQRELFLRFLKKLSYASCFQI